MSNFSPKREDATDQELKHWINESAPGCAQLASDELSRRQFKKLHESFVKFDKTTTRFSIALIFFAIAQIIIGIMQYALGVQASNGNFWDKLASMALLFLGLSILVFEFYRWAKKDKFNL